MMPRLLKAVLPAVLSVAALAACQLQPAQEADPLTEMANKIADFELIVPYDGDTLPRGLTDPYPDTFNPYIDSGAFVDFAALLAAADWVKTRCREFIKDNAASLSEGVPQPIDATWTIAFGPEWNGSANEGLSFDVYFSKLKYFLESDSLTVYVYCEAPQPDPDPPYPWHVIVRVSEDAAHPGSYLTEFTSDLDGGVTHVGHSSYDRSMIMYEDYDEGEPPTEHWNTYREYYLDDGTYGYSRVFDYVIGVDRDSPDPDNPVILDEFENLLFYDDSGIYVYERNGLDWNQGQYGVDRALVSSEPEESVLPQVFKDAKTNWTGEAQAAIATFDPALLLPLDEFADLEN